MPWLDFNISSLFFRYSKSKTIYLYLTLRVIFLSKITQLFDSWESLVKLIGDRLQSQASAFSDSGVLLYFNKVPF
jgi:hypothetical protein